MTAIEQYEQEQEDFKARLRTPIPFLHLKEPIGPVYLGCHGSKGHFFFEPGMRWVKSDENHRELCKLDGGFAPQDTGEQGLAWFFNHRAIPVSYTIISFWDYSIDQRPKSNSTFMLPGPARCFADALPEAQKLFPEVFARFTFPVKLRRNM